MADSGKKSLGETIRTLLSWKMIVMVAFGFSSGFPFYIVKDVLKAWMTDANVDLKTIGLFSAVTLPYTLKFLWAPTMDAVVPPFLGRRRAWILMAQVGLMISIAMLGQFSPTNSLLFIAIVALVVSFFGASQDIALDAFRREYLTDEELGFGNGVWMNAWRLGMYISVGAAFLAADSNISWKTIHLLLALVMFVGIITVLVVPEPKVDAAPPATLFEAVVEPFREFITRKNAFFVLAFILLYKIGDNMASAMTIPYILKQGFSKTEYFVIVKGFGFLGLFGGMLLGGAIMVRLGIAKSLWIFGVLQALSTAAFALLVAFDHEGQFWLDSREMVLTGIVGFEFLAIGMGTAAYGAFMAIQTNKRFTATQFALLSSLMAVPATIAATITGVLVEFVGWAWFFIGCAFFAVPGMLLLFKVAPWGSTNEQLDADEAR